MLKKQMENLMAGQVVLDTRNNVELEIVGVGETKVILINGKEYSKSTLKRYFKLVEQQIPEVVEPDNTVINDIEQAEDLTQEQQGNTVTVEHSDHTDGYISSQDINNLVDNFGCYIEQKKEYIAVKKQGIKGTLLQLRTTKLDGKYHIDFKSKIFVTLDEDYRDLLVKEHRCSVYDKSRGYFRIPQVDDIYIIMTILTTAITLNNKVLAV